MRDMKRNQRNLYYATAINTEPILDEYGNDTLEVLTVYSVPVKVRANVSSNTGEESAEVFGLSTEYHRTVSMTGSCPMVEGDRVWFGVEPDEEAGNNNYIVVRVADSKNGYLVALREVSVRA